MDRWRIALVALGVMAWLGMVPIPPAAADPVGPTNYRSRVLSVSPTPPSGVVVEILGGDAFVRLQVPRGHTATVPDYSTSDGAGPYLRFDADGTVRRNANAVATIINRSRSGPTREAPPSPRTSRWEVVSSDGSYQWHDHRIHLMGKARAWTGDDHRIDMGGPDGTWEIPLAIDGRASTITGELVHVPPPPSWLWWSLVPLLAVLIALVGRRRPAGPDAGTDPTAITAVLVSLASLTVGWASRAGLPAEAAPGWPILAVPAVALVASLALAGPARSRPLPRRVATAAIVATLGSWAWLRRAVLTASIVPTALPPPLDRGVTAAALGLAVGLTVGLVSGPTGPMAADPQRPVAPAAPG